MIHGKDELADELLGRTVRDATLLSLSNYDSGKSLAEIDAEIIAANYQRELGADIAAEWDDAKNKLRVAIVNLLDVIGA